VILPQTDRMNVFTALGHELSNRLSAFGELAYYRADSFNHRDPAGADGTDDFNLHVGANNPWNPFGSRFYHPTGAPNADGTPRVTGTPSDVLIAGGTGVRPREFKPKDINVLSQSIRGVAGLRGKTFADFEWESAAMYSRAWTRDAEENNIRHSLLQAALLRTDNTAFNPFGYTFRNVGGVIQVNQPYTNPAAVVDPLVDTFIREGRTELATWDARLNGTLFDFWGGRVGAALGAEYRWESYKDWRPPFHGLNPAGFVLPPNDNDFIGLSPNLNLYSDRNVISGYGEVLIPVFGRKNRRPLLEVFELSVAGRYEKFSDFGDALKPKYGAAWRPHRNLLIRGSYNESFRAPNLVQTNISPLQRSVSGVTDSYRSTVTQQITDGSSSRTVFRQGNAALEPEESDTTTVGLALEVPYIKGLTITVDWWRMNQEKVIDNLAAGGVLARDQQLLDAFTQAQIAAGTSANNAVTNSGANNYVGNPKVSRAPVTDADRAEFAAYNSTRPASSHRAPVGRLVSLIDDYLNVAGRDLEGIDMAVSYRVPKLRFGQFTLKAEATHNRKFKQKLDEFSAVDSLLEENGRARWRGNASVMWRHGSWGAGWFAEYFGGSMDSSAALATGASGAAVYEQLGRPSYIKVFNDIGGVVRYRWRIDDVIQHNAYVQHRFDRQRNLLGNITARFGVTNVFDEEPPLADESRGYQGGTVSAKGRSYYLEVTKRF
ncbi:MAG: TonB-dependent receptor domain-containing protein, partial [Opitutaceae bacterium]